MCSCHSLVNERLPIGSVRSRLHQLQEGAELHKQVLFEDLQHFLWEQWSGFIEQRATFTTPAGCLREVRTDLRGAETRPCRTARG